MHVRADVDRDIVTGEIRTDDLVFAGVKTGAHVKSSPISFTLSVIVLAARMARAGGQTTPETRHLRTRSKNIPLGRWSSPPRTRRRGLIGLPIWPRRPGGAGERFLKT
jgi:hypothetical protein